MGNAEYMGTHIQSPINNSTRIENLRRCQAPWTRPRRKPKRWPSRTSTRPRLWPNLLLSLVDTFDGVLVSRRQTGVLSEGRQLKSGNFYDPMEKLGKLIKSPFEKFTPKAFIRYIMYLPLNFIPVVGTVIFVALQGRSRGNSVHTRYFQLKKWSNPQKEAWLKENTAPYTAFGTVATLLELIPFASIFFTFTNTGKQCSARVGLFPGTDQFLVGAALWAADIEGNNTAMTEMTSPK